MLFSSKLLIPAANEQLPCGRWMKDQRELHSLEIWRTNRRRYPPKCVVWDFADLTVESTDNCNARLTGIPASPPPSPPPPLHPSSQQSYIGLRLLTSLHKIRRSILVSLRSEDCYYQRVFCTRPFTAFVILYSTLEMPERIVQEMRWILQSAFCCDIHSRCIPNLLLFKSRETKFATKIGFVATTAVTGPSTDEYSIYVAPE